MKSSATSSFWEGRLRFAWAVVVWISLSVSTSVFGQASLFDPSFAVGGGANGPVYSIVVQENGKILVGGAFTMIGNQSYTNLARLNSDGQPDTTFEQGTDGVVYKLLQQPDGKILVGGRFNNLQGVARQNIGRLLTNGLVDLDFDASTNYTQWDTVLTLAVQPDEKILAASYTASIFSSLKRFNTNGVLDDTFINTNEFNYYVTALLARTNNDILVGGGFFEVNGVSCPALAVFDSSGQIETNIAASLLDFSDIFSFAEMTNGNIALSGALYRNSPANREKILQLTPQLEWETNFNPVAIDGNSSLTYSIPLLIQPDGKIVLGGNFWEVGAYSRHGIARLDALGQTDSCFDPELGFGGAGVYTLACQLDGRILVGGSFLGGGFTLTNIARLLPQSDCDVTRTYIWNAGPNNYNVAATCAPGGTNSLQSSSNLVDWVTTQTTTSPYLYAGPYQFSDATQAFFRVMKEY